MRNAAEKPSKSLQISELPSKIDRQETSVSGFVAMEYYAVVLNRTFVVFVARDGLYGWKATGPVPAGVPNYFKSYAEMLNDPKMMHDVSAVKKLATLKGGFFIQRSEILSVEFNPKKKSGMGGIPHSGRILVGLTSGKSREFILLGNVDGEQIRRLILS